MNRWALTVVFWALRFSCELLWVAILALAVALVWGIAWLWN